jgi:hypothetical protein
MVKRNPDDLITALSANLKRPNAPVLKFTFKRGGLWKPDFAKAHSRRAKASIRDQLRAESGADEEKEWPLLVRYRENEKENLTRLNCQARLGKGAGFIESLLSVFRVNFFKKKGEIAEKPAPAPSKPQPNSKSTARKEARTVRNRERRQKRV